MVVRKQYALRIYDDKFLLNPNTFDIIQVTISIELLYETLLMISRGEAIRFPKQKSRRNRKNEKVVMSEMMD